MPDSEPHDAPRPAIGELSPDGLHYWGGDIWQWQPLWLAPDEVIEATQQRFDQACSTVHFLAAGLLNQSWRVDTDHGSYVLRVSRSERSHDQITYEHAVTQELNKHVSAVVPPLPGRDGATIQRWRGRMLSLFPFVEGVDGSAITPDARIRQAANVLAHIHRASLEHLHLGQRPGFRQADAHPRWVWTAVRPTLTRELAGTDGLDAIVDTLDRETANLDAWLDGFHASKRPLTRATVHGDFNPRNLIFRDGLLVAVIDWDDCRIEPIAWEVAQAGFGAGDVDPPAFWRTYLDAGGPLTPPDSDLLGGFARMGALSELQWTVKDGKATPHAFNQVRDVVAALAWIRAREADLTIS